VLGYEGNSEIALRIEHFSNASIQKPNPGQNFVQLRYAWNMRTP
ncbi:acyloxyacyl hydrolase, partial [bacterium]